EPGVSPGSLFRAITRVSLRSVFSEKFQAPGSWLTMMYLRSYEEVKSFRVRDQATPDNKPQGSTNVNWPPVLSTESPRATNTDPSPAVVFAGIFFFFITCLRRSCSRRL